MTDTDHPAPVRVAHGGKHTRLSSGTSVFYGCDVERLPLVEIHFPGHPGAVLDPDDAELLAFALAQYAVPAARASVITGTTEEATT